MTFWPPVRDITFTSRRRSGSRIEAVRREEKSGIPLLRQLIGAGDRILALTLPFAAIGIAANLRWPSVFRLGDGATGTIAGIILLAVGVPVWLTRVVQIIANVPRGRLITTGPYALLLHPLYTAVSLFVVPGIGLLFDSWVGLAIGAVMFLSSRLYASSEERELAERFPVEYPAYRAKVLLRRW